MWKLMKNLRDQITCFKSTLWTTSKAADPDVDTEMSDWLWNSGFGHCKRILVEILNTNSTTDANIPWNTGTLETM